MAALMLPEAKTPLHTVFESLSNRLRLVFPETHFDLHIMPPAPSKNDWNRVTRRKPAIAISWVDFKPLPGTTRVVKGGANFAVYLIVDNAEVSRRYLGDERGVGLFGMVTAASFMLHGYTIKGLGTLQISEVGEIAKTDWMDETTAVATLTVTAPIFVGEGIAGTELNDLLRLGASWLANGVDAGTGVTTMES